jgi:hypothetical protein
MVSEETSGREIGSSATNTTRNNIFLRSNLSDQAGIIAAKRHWSM